jgi:hypothetical protein
MNTSRAWPISGLLFFLSTGLALPESHPKESLPQIVQGAIDESRKNCGEPSRLNPGFILEKDVNADGRKDYILDYGKFRCGDRSTDFCGTGGCLTQVFVSLKDGTYVKALDENVRNFRFARIKGRPAMRLDLHGSACGRAGAERCNATLFWNGEKFIPAN